MKRYRVCTFDFDSRPLQLDEPKEEWEERVKQLHIENYRRTIEMYKAQFGISRFKSKLANVKAIGPKPFSIVAYHNVFLQQVRDSFIFESYYPALTGACALGERILNHLMLKLRDQFKGSPHYKKVYNKDSFSYWPQVTEILLDWGILLKNAADEFNNLFILRNESIHFNIVTESNTKEKALESITRLQNIIKDQFSAFGPQPWYFIIPGEVYIKKEYEKHPFVELCIIPNCKYVGYDHTVVDVRPNLVIEDIEYHDNRELTDEEYSELRIKSRT